MQRFSKQQLIDDLLKLETDIKDSENFDIGNGTSQLWPSGASTAVKDAIDRAAKYGRMRAYKELRIWIASGQIGK